MVAPERLASAHDRPLQSVTRGRAVQLQRRMVAEAAGALRWCDGGRTGRAQRLGETAVFVLVDEPGFVRCVLEEAAHEVGHAGDDLPGGNVDACAVALSLHGVAQPLGHAVQHLELDGIAGKASLVADDHRTGEAARVVACEGGPEVGPGRDEALTASLVALISGRLLLEDGHWVARLAGEDHLLVPVGALHQPHGDGRAPIPGNAFEPIEVVGRIEQVGLHDDAKVGPRRQNVLAHDSFERLVGEIPAAELLHVDVDEGSNGASAFEHGQEAFP